MLPAQVGWPWQVAPGPWDAVPGGRAVGKVWVSGCQGRVPPGWGCGAPCALPVTSPFILPTVQGLRAVPQLALPTMSLCPSVPVPQFPTSQSPGWEQSEDGARSCWLLFAALNSTRKETINTFLGE